MREQITRHLAIISNSGRFAGFAVTVQWYWHRIQQKWNLQSLKAWTVHPKQVTHSLTVRQGRTSDLMVFEQIFIAEEYRCLRDLKGISLIVDLGANVGFSAAYFLSCFPDSRVVAVEPDSENVAVCKRNLDLYSPRSTVLHGAVWSACTRVCLIRDAFRDGLDWSRQIGVPDTQETPDIQGWDMETILAMAGAEAVDLLKVDIERGELAIFGEESKKWLVRVRNICIELHGPDCEARFFSALADFDYELSHSGELTICRNVRLRS